MTKAVELEPNRLLDWGQTDLYRFFAFAFGPPTKERYAWFSQPGTPGALRELWQQLSCEGQFPEFIWFPDFESYEAAYIAVFDVGVPEPPVPLFESAHDKSRPAQELVLENTYFYDVLGLRVDPVQSVPDHLVTQLEFLSAVAYAGERAEAEPSIQDLARLEREFLERHVLNWTGSARKKIKTSPFPAFSILFALMCRFFDSRYQKLSY